MAELKMIFVVAEQASNLFVADLVSSGVSDSTTNNSVCKSCEKAFSYLRLYC